MAYLKCSRFTGILVLLCWACAAFAGQSAATQNMASSAAPTDVKALPSVRELLAKMAKHQKNLNYEGRFTYQYNADIESFKLEHWVDNGIQYQRLYYLNGPSREASISQHTHCRALGDKLVAGKLGGLAANYRGLDHLYRFSVRGVDRVAGRLAIVLQIMPRDLFRFGYLLSVDSKTGLLLKSLILDENQHVVERFQFIDLRTGMAPAFFSHEKAAKITHKINGDDLAGCDRASRRAPRYWRLGWLPEGFVFSGQRRVRGDIQMLMYTDGLSTFSIFLDPVQGKLAIEGRGQRGATNFYMQGVSRAQQNYQMTIVGEIPVTVAERIAHTIRPQPVAVSSVKPADNTASHHREDDSKSVR